MKNIITYIYTMMSWILFLFLTQTNGLQLWPVNINSDNMVILGDAINEWSLYRHIEISRGRNRIINMPINPSNGFGYTVTTKYANYDQIDIVIDSTRATGNILYNILLHEIGHFLGMRHSPDRRSIMNLSIPVDLNHKPLSMLRHKLGLIDLCNS